MSPFEVVTVAEGLQNPWGLAFLPDGRMLVTEKPGPPSLVGTDGKLSEPVAGLPPVDARGQGGLLDIALDPGLREQRPHLLEFCRAARGPTNNTAVARGSLMDEAAPRVENVQVIYHQVPSLNSAQHYRQPAGVWTRRDAVRHAG